MIIGAFGSSGPNVAITLRDGCLRAMNGCSDTRAPAARKAFAMYSGAPARRFSLMNRTCRSSVCASACAADGYGSDVRVGCRTHATAINTIASTAPKIRMIRFTSFRREGQTTRHADVHWPHAEEAPIRTRIRGRGLGPDEDGPRLRLLQRVAEYQRRDAAGDPDGSQSRARRRERPARFDPRLLDEDRLPERVQIEVLPAPRRRTRAV